MKEAGASIGRAFLPLLLIGWLLCALREALAAALDALRNAAGWAAFVTALVMGVALIVAIISKFRKPFGNSINREEEHE